MLRPSWLSVTPSIHIDGWKVVPEYGLLVGAVGSWGGGTVGGGLGAGGWGGGGGVEGGGGDGAGGGGSGGS